MNIVTALFLAQALQAAPSNPPRPAGTARAPSTSATQPLLPACVGTIRDQSNPSSCLQASSVPTPGMLFPPPHDGGLNNNASGVFAFIGDGINNTASGARSAIAGGSYNSASGAITAIAGGANNAANGLGSAVGGGMDNTAGGLNSTIGGGRDNTTVAPFSTIGGGRGHQVGGSLGYSTVGGGGFNTADGLAWSTVLGGFSNHASGAYGATVGGGNGNLASGNGATVAGGYHNTASGAFAAIGGGGDNTAAGSHSTVSGGALNTALGDFSFAAGRRAKANHAGAFVWGDSQNLDKTSSATDQFNIYASGGTRIFSSSPATTGVQLAPGSGTWSSVSDRDVKENFAPVDGGEVLARVAALPLWTWNYKTQDQSIRHMGPTAQDFRAAFGLGVSERLIDTVDPAGVALAAIQGLNARFEQHQREIAELRRANESLGEQLARIERSAGCPAGQGRARQTSE